MSKNFWTSATAWESSNVSCPAASRRSDTSAARPGYTVYLARLRPQGTTIALALNWNDDPTPLLIPALEALATGHR